MARAADLKGMHPAAVELALLVAIAGKMAYAVGCGLLVGIERKVNDASAGFKTQILVCVGAVLFTTVPVIAGFPQESARVIAQVVSGVGFLGAGAILHTGTSHVVGLTTAAWIWFTAAIGVLIGVGHGPVALFVTGSIVGVVTAARWFEHRFFAHHDVHVAEPKRKQRAA